MSLGSTLHIHKMYLSKETDEDRMSSCSAQTYSQKRKLDAGRRDKGNLFLWQETGTLGLYFQNWTQSQPSLIPYFKSENGLSWMAKIWSRIYRLRQKEVYFCRVIFSRFSHLTLVVAWAAVFVLAEYSRRVNAVCRYAVHSSGHLTKFYLLIASYHKITLDRSAGGGGGALTPEGDHIHFLLMVTYSRRASPSHLPFPACLGPSPGISHTAVHLKVLSVHPQMKTLPRKRFSPCSWPPSLNEQWKLDIKPKAFRSL